MSAKAPRCRCRLITFSEVTGTPPPVSITPPVFGPFPIGASSSDCIGDDRFPCWFHRRLDSCRSPDLAKYPVHRYTGRHDLLPGMGSDLVGRPSVPAHGSESSQRQAVAGTDLGSFHGLVRGQSLKAFPAGPARFLWESASPTGGNLEDPGARPPAQATMISFDLRRAIATAVSLRRWAILQGEFFLSWPDPGPENDPRPKLPASASHGLIPGRGPRQSGVGSQPNQEVSADDPDRASSWTKLLSPPVVVPSVTAIAQVFWHYVQWWKSRRHSQRERTAKTPTPSMAWDRLNVSLLVGSHPSSRLTVIWRPSSAVHARFDR